MPPLVSLSPSTAPAISRMAVTCCSMSLFRSFTVAAARAASVMISDMDRPDPSASSTLCLT